ncbi:hypothetical protein [Streptomyces sp. NPDC017095]|uniref:hypothetical protein n=1 Tax=Streptomyces sp. NPDC017095 TaxID=3364977 RepID=UPI00379F6FC1
MATEGVAQEEQGLAGGLLYTSFQFGAALGLAAVTAVAAHADADTGRLGGYRAGLLVPFAAALAATAISLTARRTPRADAAPRRCRRGGTEGSSRCGRAAPRVRPAAGERHRAHAPLRNRGRPP